MNVGLTDVQKSDLQQLWSSHASLFPVGLRPKDSPGDEQSGDDVIDDHAYGFIVRLYFFFMAAICSDNDHTSNCASLESEGGTGELFVQTLESVEFLFNQKIITTRTASHRDGSNHNAGDAIRIEGGEKRRRSHVRVPKPRSLEGIHVVTFDHRSFNSELGGYEEERRKAGYRANGPHPENNSHELSHQQPPFGAFLHHLPNRALLAVSCALGLTVLSSWRSHFSSSSPFSENSSAHLPRFIIRFLDVHPRLPLAELKTSMAYKLVSIRGHVTKARPKKLRAVDAEFQCAKCGEHMRHSFGTADGGSAAYSIPSRCYATPACRGRTFVLLRSSADYIDFQELRIQESRDEATLAGAGRAPRHVDVELTRDLVNTCKTGDVVVVSGVVNAINTAMAAGRKGKRAMETSTFKLYMDANSVSNWTASESSSSYYATNDNHLASANANADGDDDDNQSKSSLSSNRSRSKSAHHHQYDAERLGQIAKLAHADHMVGPMSARRAFPFDLLVRSLCPSILGHDLVKAGMILSLLGGTPPPQASAASAFLDGRYGAGGGTSIRSNIHVLVVGDPGMGKSQMLLAARSVAARGVYVGGNTSSTTGLTVSLTKEAGGETGIEAGALVLADRGVCCIDEFDKMAKSHHDGLLEAMEQQQISIAKAGIVASLPARCSVVAAANPKQGNYDLGKTVAENLNMASPLLSRFDLVFILRDKADEEQDRLVSRSIMKDYRVQDYDDDGGGGTNKADNPPLSWHSQQQGDGKMTKSNAQRVPLLRRLPWVAETQKRPLPADLVRDYIAYAKEYCRPKLSQEAAVVLKEYFLALRQPQTSLGRTDSVPITTRQLEALIRLSQARAKACLREFVLKEDAEDVVELMTESVNQVHMDECGVKDSSRGGAGGRSRKGKQMEELLKRMKMAKGHNGIFTMTEIRELAAQLNLDLSIGTEVLVEELREKGDLLRKVYDDGVSRYVVP